MAYKFKNLVFEGGGVKGIAYVGALEVLEKEKILSKIKRVAGTSAGAMIAVLVGLGYTYEDLKKILWDLDFKNFMDGSWGVIRNTKRLLEDYGWYKGDFFRNLMGDYIKEKTGNSESTFADIAKLMDKDNNFKDIYLIGSNLSTGYSEVFSYEHTPRMCVADAARISMSIPLFFAAIRGMRSDIYVDGGLLDNYAVRVFDRTKYVKTNLVRTEYYEQSTQGENTQDYGLCLQPRDFGIPLGQRNRNRHVPRQCRTANPRHQGCFRLYLCFDEHAYRLPKQCAPAQRRLATHYLH